MSFLLPELKTAGKKQEKQFDNVIWLWNGSTAKARCCIIENGGKLESTTPATDLE